MDKISVLKIDKDCHVGRAIEQDYLALLIEVLRKHGLKVRWIKATRTRHGSHYYICISSPVDANIANRLQFLLGDDAKRVALNQARIDSGLRDWNKLFEAAGRPLRTLYFEFPV